jgi:acetyl esterase
MIYDPQLEPLIDEQRRFNAAAGVTPGRPPTPPPADPDQLPGTDEPLPHRPEVALRIMRPPNVALRGVYLHFHGGGFRAGNAINADRSNSALARALSVATVSVNYRLAPQFPYPAAFDDAEAAAVWLIDQAPGRFGVEHLLIGGDSVGASLAVSTLLRLRDRGLSRHFRGANLVVGAYDFSMTPSQRASTDELFLSPARLAETREGEFPGLSLEALRSPQYSSLYADLSGLPPAVFTIGMRDAMLDDSLFMAMRWRAAGNPAQLEVYPEGTHLFFMQPTAMATEARRRIQAFMDRALS